MKKRSVLYTWVIEFSILLILMAAMCVTLTLSARRKLLDEYTEITIQQQEKIETALNNSMSQIKTDAINLVARQFFCETRTEFLRKNSPVLRSKSETRSLASTAPKMEGAAHVKGRVLAWGGAAFAAPPLAFCPWGSSYPSVASPASSAASWAATGSVYSDQP